MAVEGLFEGEKRLYSMNKSTREFNYINSFDLIIYANMILDIAKLVLIKKIVENMNIL